MKTIREYKTETLLGQVNGKNIYLTSPSWDFGWYWGFGYLGNKHCCYHISGLKKIETYNFDKKCFEYKFVNLYDGLKRHFDEGTFVVKKDDDIWKLAELFASFYLLKETAEMYYLGGAHYTSNPCKDLIKNNIEYQRINNEVLPAIFDEIYKILESYE